MAQRGVDGTSMRDLASAAGLNVASLYHYFPSKRDLLESVLIEQGFLPIRPVHTDPDGAEPRRRTADPGPAPGRDHDLHVRGRGLRPPHGRRGDARRGDRPRRRPATSSPRSRRASRTGSRRTVPTSTRVRAPPRWPASSAPWSSGSSSSTPPMCSARRGMTSPPCPSTGPARRPPSSGRPISDSRSGGSSPRVRHLVEVRDAHHVALAARGAAARRRSAARATRPACGCRSPGRAPEPPIRRSPATQSRAPPSHVP